jgi:hypothetical protein
MNHQFVAFREQPLRCIIGAGYWRKRRVVYEKENYLLE